MRNKKIDYDEAESAAELEVEAIMEPDGSTSQATSEAEGPVETDTEPSEKLLVIDGENEAKTEPTEVNESSSEPEENDLNDTKTDSAVAEISRDNSDELLDAQDDAAADELPEKPPNHRKFWRIGFPIIVLLVLIIAAIGVPSSRCWLFNHLGLRSSASLVIMNESTNQPIQNVTVKLGDQSAMTDAHGQATFQKIKFGPLDLSANLPGFSDLGGQVRINWFGKHELGEFSLKPTGINYKFKLTDYLTGQPIIGGLAASDGSTVASDTTGLAVLALGRTTKDKRDVKFTSDGYNPKTVSVAAIGSGTTAEVKLVPAGRDYFISGSEVLSTNLDGGDQKLVMAGVDGPTALLADDDGSMIALVSSVASAQKLTIINAGTLKAQPQDSAQKIQLIGWLDGGTTLVYTAENTCGGNPCDQLTSYNYKSATKRELVASSGFEAVLTVSDEVFYVTANDYNSAAKPEFVSMNADGTDKNVILTDNIYGVYRASYNNILVAATGQWYGFDAGAGSLQKIDPPTNPAGQVFVASPDGKKAALISNGLAIYDTASKDTKPLAGTGGASYPLRWVGDSTIIYRSGSSDFVVSLLGGAPQKIADVANVAGAGYTSS